MRNAQKCGRKAEKTAFQAGASICAELNAAATLQKTGSKNEVFGCDLMQSKESKGGIYDGKAGLYSGFQWKNR